MVIEVVLLIPLLALYHYKIISGYTIVSVALFVYWIPKFFFIRLLESNYPEIVTRKQHMWKVALTFDDVPYGAFQQILQVLDDNEMKGTFFVISGDVDDDTYRLLIKAVQNGHQLANHGLTNSMHVLKSKANLENEISSCQNLITEIYKLAGIELPKKQFYRPGCGLFNRQMLDTVKEFGLITALGSVYPNDPMIPFDIVNYLYLINHIEGGDVVVLHDRTWTPSMLIQLIEWMQINKLSSVTMNELLE